MKKITLPKILQPFYCKDLIRFGKNNDGGYLINPEDVKKSSHLISLGVKDDWSFEEDFAKHTSCSIEAYDGEVDEKSRKNLEDFFVGNKTFINKNVGIGTDDVILASIIKENSFLKCDIEGGEYALLDTIITNRKKFTGIVIEFHDISVYENFNLLTSFIGKIDQKLIHVHINNWFYFISQDSFTPSVIELTFSSSDNITYQNVKLPHNLDMPNCPFREDFVIEF